MIRVLDFYYVFGVPVIAPPSLLWLYEQCRLLETSDSSFYRLYEGLFSHFDEKQEGIFNTATYPAPTVQTDTSNTDLECVTWVQFSLH